MPELILVDERTNERTTAKDIIRRLLTVDPSVRITARGAMEHPWLASLNANLPERVQEKLVHDEDDEEPSATSSTAAEDDGKPTSPSVRADEAVGKCAFCCR